jgi:hypothetical protein
MESPTVITHYNEGGKTYQEVLEEILKCILLDKESHNY